MTTATESKIDLALSLHRIGDCRSCRWCGEQIWVIRKSSAFGDDGVAHGTECPSAERILFELGGDVYSADPGRGDIMVVVNNPSPEIRAVIDRFTERRIRVLNRTVA